MTADHDRLPLHPIIKDIDAKLRVNMLPGEIFLGNYENAQRVAERNADPDDIDAHTGRVRETPEKIAQGLVEHGFWRSVRVLEQTYDIYGNLLPHSVALVGVPAENKS